MTDYSIDPSGVVTVVTTVAEHLAGEDGSGGGGLIKQLENFGVHVENAATAASSFPVGTALLQFVEYAGPNLEAMVTKGSACITGAVDATAAYIEGDTQMLDEAQRNAVNAPAPTIGK